MEQPYRPTKRPVGWTKPYWSRAGMYVFAVLLSFLISLLLVGFGCGILLQAAVEAPPLVWRIIAAVLDALICIGVTGYLSAQEGYAKHRARLRVSAGGGLLFLLMQIPLAMLFQGAPYVTGPLASSLAQAVYFGNASLFVSELDAPPVWLTMVCMVLADGLVLVPAMCLGDRLGAASYRQEQAQLIGKADESKE